MRACLKDDHYLLPLNITTANRLVVGDLFNADRVDW